MSYLQSILFAAIIMFFQEVDVCIRDNCINKVNSGTTAVNITAHVLMHHVVITYAGHCKYERKKKLPTNFPQASVLNCFILIFCFVQILDVPNSPASLKDVFL